MFENNSLSNLPVGQPQQLQKISDNKATVSTVINTPKAVSTEATPEKKVNGKKLALALAAVTTVAVAGVAIAKGRGKKTVQNTQEIINDANKIINGTKDDILASGNILTREFKDGKMQKATLCDKDGKIIHIKEYSECSSNWKVTTKNGNGKVTSILEYSYTNNDKSDYYSTLQIIDPITDNLIEFKEFIARPENYKVRNLVFDPPSGKPLKVITRDKYSTQSATRNLATNTVEVENKINLPDYKYSGNLTYDANTFELINCSTKINGKDNELVKHEGLDKLAEKSYTLPENLISELQLTHS